MGETCTLSISVPGSVTLSQLENGTTNNTNIFGTITGTCNRKDGFRYQIKSTNNACEFKHTTLPNAVPYTFNVGTPAMISGGAIRGAKIKMKDGCPTLAEGYDSVWNVPSGKMHINETMSFYVNIAGAGVGQLPSGTYQSSLMIRIVDGAL